MTQARSMVITRLGIVATSQVLASRAGAQVLEIGGNAVDAAIAANAVLGVVEPTGCGLGGDLFAILSEGKSGRLHGLNASGWAPAKMNEALLRRRGYASMPETGILSVTVPGCVAGWDALRQKFGTLPFETLLKPAIYYAEQGFPVTERIGTTWAAAEQLPRVNAAFQQTFLPSGRAPRIGEIFQNGDLARSLRRISEGGRGAFYRGPIAKAILELSRGEDGPMEASDLAELEAEWVDPISTDYRGWTVSELPPNSQGIAALMMLNLLEQFPLATYGHGSPDALHLMIEAKKLAYADLLRYVADARFSPAPVGALLSKAHAKERARQIEPDRAMTTAAPSEAGELAARHGADTIYLAAADAEGNIVSLIQSNYLGFGSGLVAPGTGFGLQNRGALFNLEPGHPNALAPRKRPLHTIIPGFMQKGDVRIGFGIMGGWNQAQAHAQFVSHVVDFGLNIQAALEAPRFIKATFEGLDVQIEARIDPSTCAELTRRGHQLEILEAYSPSVGGGQAVMRKGEGVSFGGSDPRKDGAAEPQAPPVFGRRS